MTGRGKLSIAGIVNMMIEIIPEMKVSFDIPSFLVISCTHKSATCSVLALDEHIRVSTHAPT